MRPAAATAVASDCTLAASVLDRNSWANMRAPRMTIAGSEIKSEPASTLAKNVSTEIFRGPRALTPLGRSLITTRGFTRTMESCSSSVRELRLLSSMAVLDQSFPARAGEVGGQSALSCRGGGDLLGCNRNRPAALGDVLDGEHDLFGGAALLLARALHLAADLGHRLHHLQPALPLFDTLLERHDGLAARRLGAFDELGDLCRGRLGALDQPPHLVGDNGKTAARVARPRGLDRGVEGEQVGLVCDVVDQVEGALELVHPAGQGEGPVARRPEIGLRELEGGLHLSG